MRLLFIIPLLCLVLSHAPALLVPGTEGVELDGNRDFTANVELAPGTDPGEDFLQVSPVLGDRAIQMVTPTGTAAIHVGNYSPQLTGQTGNAGDLFLRVDTEELWHKVGVGDNDWNLIVTSTGAQPNEIIEGGMVSWTGAGLVFDVSYTKYRINGVIYEYAGGQITLTAGGAAARFDSIIVDLDLDPVGNVDAVEGVEAADPQIPSVDPETEIFLTAVLIGAGASVPTITREVIYDEDVEWTTAENGGVTDFLVVTDPQNGSVHMAMTAAQTNDFATFTSTDFDITAFEALRFYIQPLSDFDAKGFLTMVWSDNGIPLGTSITLQEGDYGLDTSKITWQVITIPMADFGAIGSTVDTLTISARHKGAGTVTAWFDVIEIQTGLTQVVQGTLDDAYDSGGSGAGREITGDFGAVKITVPTGAGNQQGMNIVMEDTSTDTAAYAAWVDAGGQNVGWGYSVATDSGGAVNGYRLFHGYVGPPESPSFSDANGLMGGTSNPRTTPTYGDAGSIYLMAAGVAFIKRLDGSAQADWGQIVAPDGTLALGDLAVFDGADWEVLPNGTSGQVLVESGGTAAWGTAATQIADGTVTHSVMRWDGADWVEETALFIDASGNIYPAVDNTINAGSAAAGFLTGFFNNIGATAQEVARIWVTELENGSGFINIDADLTPTVTNTYDLGSPTNRFELIHGDEITTEKITGRSGTVTIDSLLPLSGGVDDIGAIANEFDNAFINDITTDSLTAEDGAAITTDTIVPLAGTDDLGTVASPWDQLNVDGAATLHGQVALGNGDADQIVISGSDVSLTNDDWIDGEVADTLTIGAASTVADGALSSNVPLKNAANVFSALNTFTAGIYVSTDDVVIAAQDITTLSGASNITEFNNIYGANLRANSTMISNGDTTIGNADTDDLTLVAEIVGDVVGDVDNATDLGDTGSDMGNIYVNTFLDNDGTYYFQDIAVFNSYPLSALNLYESITTLYDPILFEGPPTGQVVTSDGYMTWSIPDSTQTTFRWLVEGLDGDQLSGWRIHFRSDITGDDDLYQFEGQLYHRSFGARTWVAVDAAFDEPPEDTGWNTMTDISGVSEFLGDGEEAMFELTMYHEAGAMTLDIASIQIWFGRRGN